MSLVKKLKSCAQILFVCFCLFIIYSLTKAQKQSQWLQWHRPNATGDLSQNALKRELQIKVQKMLYKNNINDIIILT